MFDYHWHVTLALGGTPIYRLDADDVHDALTLYEKIHKGLYDQYADIDRGEFLASIGGPDDPKPMVYTTTMGYVDIGLHPCACTRRAWSN